VMGGSVLGLHGGFWDTILIRPLAAMSMFVLALLAPLMLLRHAHGGIGHPVGRLAGYASMRLATNAVGSHLPEQFGGRRPRAAAPAPELQLTRDLATGAVSGRQSLSVPINGDTSDAVQAFLDGVSNSDASGTGATAFPAARAGAGRTVEDRGEVAPIGAASAISAGVRPRGDAERFAFRDPGSLSFADSLASERVRGRGGQTEPSVSEGRAALESFSPRMQERIQDQYRVGAPASGAEGRLGGSAFRATMAASALSEEISDRQAGALAVLAGVGDEGLTELFAGSRGPAPPGDGSPRGADLRAGSAGAGGERREAHSRGRLATFGDELSDTRPAPLVAEQPAPRPGKE
jgi:hypothetical protein